MENVKRDIDISMPVITLESRQRKELETFLLNSNYMFLVTQDENYNHPLFLLPNVTEQDFTYLKLQLFRTVTIEYYDDISKMSYNQSHYHPRLRYQSLDKILFCYDRKNDDKIYHLEKPQDRYPNLNASFVTSIKNISSFDELLQISKQFINIYDMYQVIHNNELYLNHIRSFNLGKPSINEVLSVINKKFSNIEITSNKEVQSISSCNPIIWENSVIYELGLKPFHYGKKRNLTCKKLNSI